MLPTGYVIVPAGEPVKTIYDWTTLALFCALALLFLQRSVGPAVPSDRAILYLPPALACMAANGLGNAGYNAASFAVILATLGYAAFVLRPWVRLR